MSDDNTTNGTSAPVEPNAKEAMFFYHILTSNKTKLDVDWEQVAQKVGYSNGACAKVRFGQVKKRLGLNEEGGAAANSGAPKSTTPKKARVKKEVGSGTNKTPSKVTKARTPKKAPISASKAAEAEFFLGLAGNDEALTAENGTHEENGDYEHYEGGREEDYYGEDSYHDANEVEGGYFA